jgi:hypothetical protein
VKLIGLLFAALMLISCAPLNPRDETPAEVDQAIEQFHNFYKPGLILITHRDEVGSPWVARIYRNDQTLTEWEESGYPRLMLAVKAVEKDYEKYPNGHIGKY